MAKQQEMVLRSYDLGFNSEITLEDIKSAFEDVENAANLNVFVFIPENEPAVVALGSKSAPGYMAVKTHLERDRNNIVSVSEVYGRGAQIRATDLEKLYYKGLGAFNKFQYRMEQGSSIKRLMSGGGIAGGIGAATGLAIRGTFKLAAKGVRALLRDKEAYEKEMDFYKLALGIIDFVIGGADTANIITSIKEEANNGNVISQYVLGSAYAEGRGVEASEEIALSWYEKAAEQGELRSQNIVAGEFLYGEKNYSIDNKELGIQYLHNLLNSGEEWVIPQLTDIYALGVIKDISPNYNKAIEFTTEYAEQGYIYPTYILAKIFDGSIENGTNDISNFENIEAASDIYRNFISNNIEEYVEESALKLLDFIKNGRIEPLGNGEFVHLYEIIANKGDVDAKCKLIDLYTTGQNVPINLDEAKKYWNDVASSGNANYLPIVYYSQFKYADSKEQYKDSLNFAKKYLECENTDQEREKELSEYITDLETKIAAMPEEERREFLKEPKPFKINKTMLGIILGICAIAIIGLMISVSLKHRASSKDNLSELSFNNEISSFNTDVEASGDTEEALNAYRDLLSNGPFNRDITGDSDEMWEPSECKFNIAYIDNDDVPELLLTGPGSHATGFGQIYTYKEGNIVSITRVSSPTAEDIGEPLGYYEKSGWYEAFGMWQGYGAISTVSTNSETEIVFSRNYEPSESGSVNLTSYTINYGQGYNEKSEEVYYNELHELVGDCDYIEYVYYENTEENREKILSISEQGSNDDKVDDVISEANSTSNDNVTSAYITLLSKDYIERDNTLSDGTEVTEKIVLADAQFAIANITGDYPQLIIYGDGGFQIYNYDGGSVVCIENNSRPDFERSSQYPIGYYEGTGYYVGIGRIGSMAVHYTESLTSGESLIVDYNAYTDNLEEAEEISDSVTYRKLYESGESYYSKEEYYEDIRTITNGQELIPFDLYDNTEENRNRILSVGNPTYSRIDSSDERDVILAFSGEIDGRRCMVPMVNYNSPGAVELNDKLWTKYYEGMVTNEHIEEITWISTHGASYVSLLMFITNPTSQTYDVYNISIPDGQLLTTEEVLELEGISVDEWESIAKQYIENKFVEQYGQMAGSDFYNQQLAKSLSDENIRETVPFLNMHGELQPVYWVYSMAGAEKYQFYL